MASVLVKNADGTFTQATPQIIFNGSSSEYPTGRPQMVYDTNVDRFVVIWSTRASAADDDDIKGVVLDIDPSDNSIDAGTTIDVQQGTGDKGCRPSFFHGRQIDFMTGRK